MVNRYNNSGLKGLTSQIPKHRILWVESRRFVSVDPPTPYHSYKLTNFTTKSVSISTLT